jgi:hypothetical protein
MCGPVSCVGVSLIIFIVMLVYAIINIIKYDARNDFEDFMCNITKVQYPKDIPTNFHDFTNDNFVKCDCGKRCISDLGICSKIYVHNINNEEVLLQNRFDSDDSLCTFRESKCKGGEKINNRISKLYKNIEKMKFYEDAMNNNTLIDCYKYDDVYFINNYNYMKEMIIFISLSFTFFITTIITFNFCCSK